MPVSRSTSTWPVLLGPVVGVILLALMAMDRKHYRTQSDFAPFHEKAAKAISNWPKRIGCWMGGIETFTDDELRLLQPNAAFKVRYIDSEHPMDASRNVVVMLIQCAQATNMRGHYPPNCYPAQGYVEIGPAMPRTWKIDDFKIDGMEYHYERPNNPQSLTVTYNFMILPEEGIKRDMKAIYESADDYQKSYYGAAQVQVVFGGALAEASTEMRTQRDQILVELLSPGVGTLKLLTRGVE